MYCLLRGCLYIYLSLYLYIIVRCVNIIRLRMWHQQQQKQHQQQQRQLQQQQQQQQQSLESSLESSSSEQQQLQAQRHLRASNSNISIGSNNNNNNGSGSGGEGGNTNKSHSKSNGRSKGNNKSNKQQQQQQQQQHHHQRDQPNNYFYCYCFLGAQARGTGPRDPSVMLSLTNGGSKSMRHQHQHNSKHQHHHQCNHEHQHQQQLQQQQQHQSHHHHNHNYNYNQQQYQQQMQQEHQRSMALRHTRTRELVETLRRQGVYETLEEGDRRKLVHARLDSLVKMWIRDVGLSQGMPVERAEGCGGHVETFGSYRLGVHHRGSDIDALCVVPRHVTRSDYFGSFVKLLRTESEITDIRTIEKAYVPVLKMKFSGIDIDLLFARLELDVIPSPSKLDLKDNSLLATLDTKCVRSLNGCRVTDQILSLVPNVDAFKLTLRVVRLWAKRNNIYSNILGFLGGVSWAILVAYTCQLYPRHDPAQLIREFFRLFSRWDWPSPVCLRAPEQVNFGFPVWFNNNNINNNNNNNNGGGNGVVSVSGSNSSEFGGYQEREALMPIITPCYPEQNTTYNVSRSSRRVIVEAFERGYATISAILDNQAPWDTLFEPVVFFGRYKEHVTVFANSTTKHKHLLWCGFIEARIRHLIERLERHKCISVAHVHSESYSPPYGNQGYCSVWYIGLAFDKEDVEVNLQHDLQRFTEITKAQAEQIKLFKADMDLTAIHTKRSNNKEKLVQHDQQNDDNYNNNNDDIVADTTAYHT